LLKGLFAASVVGTLVVAGGCWILGGAEWLSFAGLFLSAQFAAHTLPRQETRKIFLISLIILALLLALCQLRWLPTDRLFPPLASSLPTVQSLAAYAGFLAIFAALCFNSDYFMSNQEQRETMLRHVNERLKDLNSQLREKHFSLLCSQQDLILANEKLKLKSEEVLQSQDVIRTLAAAVEAKDNYTEGHSGRVADFAVWLAMEMGLSSEEQSLIRSGCYLHDIGKINVSDLILRKDGPLTPVETEQMRRHPVTGEQICKPLAFARPFLDIIRHHHERMDGKGYPDGLEGDEISIPARVAAIADAWDAMTSDRPYRTALSFEEAIQRLKQGAGSQWDPHLVEVFSTMMMKRAFQNPRNAAHA
jgi:putative nucleotidyltransferase with HDIG domain